jgi:hypothetical protein
MPNHLHALIGFSNSGKKLDKIVGNGRRFMAYGIVDKLKEQNDEIILDKLSKAVNASDRKRGKLDEVLNLHLILKNVLQKNLSFRNWITSIIIHVQENGILLTARKIIFIVLPGFIIKVCKEFTRLRMS